MEDEQELDEGIKVPMNPTIQQGGSFRTVPLYTQQISNQPPQQVLVSPHQQYNPILVQQIQPQDPQVFIQPSDVLRTAPAPTVMVRVFSCQNHSQVASTKRCRKCGAHICDNCFGGSASEGDIDVVVVTIVVLLVVFIAVFIGFLALFCLLFLGVIIVCIPRFYFLRFLFCSDTGPKVHYCKPCYKKKEENQENTRIIVSIAVLLTLLIAGISFCLCCCLCLFPFFLVPSGRYHRGGYNLNGTKAATV